MLGSVSQNVLTHAPCSVRISRRPPADGAPRSGAVRVIIREAERWSADCIFVGAKGQSAIERFLLGSVSASVAARAPCSVEVVRQG